MQRRYLLWAVVLIVALIATALYTRPTGGLQEAPDVAYTTVRGEHARLGALRGHVLLVNFWATDCSVCLQEMPQLVATHAERAGRGLETLAVAMAHDSPLRVAQYAQATGLPFRVAFDADGSVARSFANVRATPTTFVIDRRGRVVRRYVGAPDFAELGALLDRLLAEPA